MTGAVYLAESLFHCCQTPERFRIAFEQLAPALTDNLQKCFEMFRNSSSAFNQLQGDQLTVENPIAVEISTYLKLILNWVSIHN